ncbi:MAG: hypothetical protein Q7S21_02095 [archaeon]|nr:hypothetical protein [archaeon]
MALVLLEDFEKLYTNKWKIPYGRVNGLFPIEPSENLASIVADLMSDGHLQGAPKWRFDYTSNSVEELYRFEKVLFNLFGVKGKIRKCSTNKYGTMNYGVNNKPLAKILFLCGVPTGAKVDKDYSIPEWIINNPKLFRIFIIRYFSCEGSVERTGRIDVQIAKNLTLIPSGINFMNQIRNSLFLYFGIVTNQLYIHPREQVRKNKISSRMIVLKIGAKDQLLNFYNKVGFEGPKMEKLKQALELRRML